jgi:hypothetical protein
LEQENLQKVESMIDKYKGSWFRPLVQWINIGGIPVGPMFDTLIDTVQSNFSKMIEKREMEFFNELINIKINPSEDVLTNHDTLHAFLNTYRFIKRTKTEEKIRLFAKLFKNGITSGLVSKADEYDYFLSILDELSLRELITLELLDNYENEAKCGEISKMYFWPDFYQHLKDRLSFTSNAEIDAFLERLSRTGCYLRKEGGARLSGGLVGTIEREVQKAPEGHLTPTYFHLKRLIEKLGEDFAQYRKVRP